MTASGTGFEAILWDNDGVLVDTERLYYQATREIMAEAGVELDADAFRDYFLSEAVGAWHLLAEQGYAESEIARFRERRDRRHAELLSRPGLDIPGAIATLRSLHEHFVMAIVTSAHREHFERSHEHTGMVDFMRFVLTREDYANSKPDPEPYLLAVERIGIPAERCLVVEDSARGLRAAKAAGLTCWIIPTELSQGSDFGRADRIVGQIRDVETMLLGKSSS